MKKVLVVDDHLSLRLLVATILDNPDYEVLEARDGHEALALALTHRPDLVLLDVMMPEMNGLEVCRTIKSDPRLAGTKVVMLTAKARPRDEGAGIAAGADAYLTKPFKPRELQALVEQLLNPAYVER
ncbi:MAG: two-component system response regulator [Dehalococcoidia bacterium]|nr:two-component system response regulator [Dehalococcoidia bacterium]